MGRCNGGRSGWVLRNKWPQASWGKTAIILLCSQILLVRKLYRAQEGGPRSHLERLEWLGRPEAGDWNHLDASSLRHLLPGLGWLEGWAHLGLLSGAPTRGLSPPSLGFSLHGAGFRRPRGGSTAFMTLLQKTQGHFHHSAWLKQSQACPDLRGGDTDSAP